MLTMTQSALQIEPEQRNSHDIRKIDKMLNRLTFYSNHLSERMQLCCSTIARTQLSKAGSFVYKIGAPAEDWFMVYYGVVLLVERTLPVIACYKLQDVCGRLTCQKFIPASASQQIKNTKLEKPMEIKCERLQKLVKFAGRRFNRGGDPVYIHWLESGDAFGINNYSTVPFERCARGFQVARNCRNPTRKHDVVALEGTFLNKPGRNLKLFFQMPVWYQSTYWTLRAQELKPVNEQPLLKPLYDHKFALSRGQRISTHGTEPQESQRAERV